VWRAYLIHKRRAGTDALSSLYRAIKQVAAEEGKPDFLVSGNDIPVFSLGWVRGDLDMVSTELTWGWWLTTGPRGLMPPPEGSYVPIYKLAREHARSRFVNAWMYVPENVQSHPNLARVLYYQALANHAGPMPLYGGRTVGSEAVDADYFAFIRSAVPTLSEREPLQDVGLYYSSSSQLTEMLPGGFRDMEDQPHSFAFYGWATALTRLHAQWRALPEWKVTSEELAGLHTLIIPDSAVFPAEDVHVVEGWVRAGGRLIVTGESGNRLGESGNFARAPDGSTLSALTRDAGVGPGGRVLHLPHDPGRPFYTAERDRAALLPAIKDALRAAPSLLAAEDVPWQVGLSLYGASDRLFVDVSNTQVDLDSDAVTPTPRLRFAARLTPELQGRELRARTLSPDGPMPVDLRPLPDGWVELSLPPITIYACVAIEPTG
jgi:hypothetical protein